MMRWRMSLGACLGLWLKKTLMDLAADIVAVPLTARFLLHGSRRWLHEGRTKPAV